MAEATYIHILSDRAIYQSLTYMQVDRGTDFKCGGPNGSHTSTVVFWAFLGKTPPNRQIKSAWANPGQKLMIHYPAQHIESDKVYLIQ